MGKMQIYSNSTLEDLSYRNNCSSTQDLCIKIINISLLVMAKKMEITLYLSIREGCGYVTKFWDMGEQRQCL